MLLLLAILLLLGIPGYASASDSSEGNVSSEEAIAAALYQVVMDQQINNDSKWKNKNINADTPIAVYDASDEITSYIVNLEYDGKPAGFIEVSNNHNDFPILTYGYDSNRLNEQQMNQLISEEDISDDVKNRKVVVVAPGKFGIKSDLTDGSAILTTEIQKTIIKKGTEYS